LKKLSSWLKPYGLKPTKAMEALLKGFQEPKEKLWREAIVKAARLYLALSVLQPGNFQISSNYGSLKMTWDGLNADILVRTDPKHSRRIETKRFQFKWLASSKGKKHLPSASPWNTGVGMVLSVLTPATGEVTVKKLSHLDSTSWNRKKNW